MFNTSLPLDDEWQRDTQPKPAGQNVLKDILARLSEVGFECSEARQHRFYGWCAEVRLKEEWVWLLVQRPEPCILILKDQFGASKLLKPSKLRISFRTLVDQIYQLILSQGCYSDLTLTDKHGIGTVLQQY